MAPGWQLEGMGHPRFALPFVLPPTRRRFFRGRSHRLVFALATGLSLSMLSPATGQEGVLLERENQTAPLEDDAAASPPHDLVIQPGAPGTILRDAPERPPAGALEESMSDDDGQKSGAFSQKMMDLRMGSTGTLDDVVPYSSATVLSGPDFKLFGGRYGFRIELGRPHSLPWEAVPPPIDVTGDIEGGSRNDAFELADVLWLPLMQVGFL